MSLSLLVGMTVISILFLIIFAEDGHDPNEKYEDLEGQGAIHAAAAIGNLPIVHILLQVSKVRLMIQVPCMGERFQD